MDRSDEVIVAVDASPHAPAALRWAVDYGGRHQVPVTIVGDRAERRQRVPGDPTLGVGTCPDLGAASHDARLIVIGAGDLAHHPLSHDVTADLVHHARCPLAIVRDHPYPPTAAVVVGIDHGAASRAALQWAVDDCATTGRPLVAVHAWHIPARVSELFTTDDDVARVEQAAARILDDAVGSLERHPTTVPVATRTVYGTASGALLYAVEDAAMIVIGSRHRNAVQRTFVGSTSALVAREAPGVVVIVPPSS